MKKIVKNILLSLAIIILLLALAVFLRPSLLVNRSNLVRLTGNVSNVTYKDIDLEISSPAILEKKLKFAAKDLCIRNEKVDACFPNVAVELDFTIGWERLRIKSIKEFVVDDGRLTLNIPPSSPKAPSTDSGGQGGSSKLSVIFRILELLTDLSGEDIANLSVKNFSYFIDLKGGQYKGSVNVQNEAGGVVFSADNYFKGEKAAIIANFNEGAAIEVFYNDNKALSFKTRTRPLAEFLEYIASKESYRYRKKELKAELGIENLATVLKMMGYTDTKLKGPVRCRVELNLNTPKIDDATLSLDVTGNLMDGGEHINFEGEAVYYFYQKIPKITIAKLETSNVGKAMKFLSDLAEKMDCHLNYRQTGGKIEITISRDYSKLPKRVY